MPLGSSVTDFVVRRAAGDYVLVELEAPSRRMFRADGQQTQELTHAIDQTYDWIRYIQDNLGTVRRELDLPELTPQPERWIVIGRRRDLTDENRRKVQVIEGSSPGLRILTYDDLLSNTRQVFENLLGPLTPMSTNVEVFYPPAEAH